jgi:hypothetical protein
MDCGKGDPSRAVEVAQAERLGDCCSSAHDSRCRIIGTCAFQQATEQNMKELPFRLHVDTLQAQ